MKTLSKLLLLSVIILAVINTHSTVQAQLFDVLKNKSKELFKDNAKVNGFTEQEAVDALKEALTNGITKGTAIVSKQDGYFSNPIIKIPFPKDAENVEQTLRKIGMGKQVDDAVLSLNRAAEDAAKSALDIFIDAIKQMSFADAYSIVRGDKNAGTVFLRKATSISLTNKFKPIIKQSLDKVEATKYWTTVMTTYNQVPFVKKVNPDLTAYVTERALDGLFTMIEQEEASIRKDPMKQASSLLKKVFSGC